MLMLLTIVTIAVVVLLFTAAEKCRCIGLAVGVLCLALGGRSVALLSDVYSEGLVSSQVSAQEVADAAVPAESTVATEVETSSEGQPAEAVSTEVADPATQATEASGEDQTRESKAATKDEAAGEKREVEPEPKAEDPTDDLIVGTVTDVEFLTERPQWVETTSDLSGDVHRMPIESGLYSSKRETDRALMEQINRSIADYIDDHVGQSYASKLINFDIQQVGDADTREFHLSIDGRSFRIADSAFDEQVRVSVGVMHQSHALVTIDQSVREQIDHRWSEITAMYRLAQAGLGAGVVLLLLGTMFGYFKLDTATRGYYTGRLQFAAAGAILALIAASVVLGKWIPWL